jgi:hypothetical protein
MYDILRIDCYWFRYSTHHNMKLKQGLSSLCGKIKTVRVTSSSIAISSVIHSPPACFAAWTSFLEFFTCNRKSRFHHWKLTDGGFASSAIPNVASVALRPSANYFSLTVYTQSIFLRVQRRNIRVDRVDKGASECRGPRFPDTKNFNVNVMALIHE